MFGESFKGAEFGNNLPELKTEFSQNMRQNNRIQLGDITSSLDLRDSQKIKLKLFDTQNIHLSHLRQNNRNQSETKVKPKFWQTNEFTPDHFLIVPWSPLFLIWNFILLVVVAYDSFMVLFSFSLGFEVKGNFIIVDIVCICLLAVDIFMRANTAVTTPNKFCFDKEKVLSYYLNTWLLLDVISFFPFCYLLMISPGIDYKYIALARLPRMLKVLRINESINILKWNSDVRIEVYRLVQLFLLKGLTAHCFACGFGAIGKRDNKSNKRFDG